LLKERERARVNRLKGKGQDLLVINIPDKNLIEVVLPASAHVPVVVPAVHDILPFPVVPAVPVHVPDAVHDIVPLLVVVVPAVLPAVPVVLPVHDIVPLPAVPAVHVPHDSENMSGNDLENMSDGSCSDSQCEEGNVVAENDAVPKQKKKRPSGRHATEEIELRGPRFDRLSHKFSWLDKSKKSRYISTGEFWCDICNKKLQVGSKVGNLEVHAKAKTYVVRTYL
jgi:hypothetical protein